MIPNMTQKRIAKESGSSSKEGTKGSKSIGKIWEELTEEENEQEDLQEVYMLRNLDMVQGLEDTISLFVFRHASIGMIKMRLKHIRH